jgi:hypothetical protein
MAFSPERVMVDWVKFLTGRETYILQQSVASWSTDSTPYATIQIRQEEQIGLADEQPTDTPGGALYDIVRRSQVEGICQVDFWGGDAIGDARILRSKIGTWEALELTQGEIVQVCYVLGEIQNVPVLRDTAHESHVFMDLVIRWAEDNTEPLEDIQTVVTTVT